MSDLNSDKEKSQESSSQESSEGGCRPTFYMNKELLEAIEAQCATEGNKKRSPFLAEILGLLLQSSTGERLRENAQKHRRALVNEIEANLLLFNEHIPTERICKLADASQRHPDQMLVRLILLGLRVYEHGLERMEADIEGS